MAQKRMIDKKISVSEQVANLPERGQLIFTWSIPHADDIGLLPFSLKTLKATIVPMMDISLGEFEKIWNTIVEQKLIGIFEYENQKFYRVTTFLKNQTLKRDRQPNTLLQFKFSEHPKESWEKLLSIIPLENIGSQLETNEFQVDTEVKGSKEKRSKGKKDIYPSDFEDFWKIYPKKVGKTTACKYWKDLSAEEKKKAMADIPVRLEKDEKWLGGFIKDPERYIKYKQWDDEIIAPKVGGKPRKTVDKF